MYNSIYANKDSTYYYANKLINYSKEENNHFDELSVYLYSNKSAIYFNDHQTIKKNLQEIDAILSKHKTSLDTINGIEYLKNLINYDRSSYNYKTNNYETAKLNLETIISNITKKPDSLLSNDDRILVNDSYTLIAKMFSNDGKYKQAED